jgi:Flp pilus assembly protein TadB
MWVSTALLAAAVGVAAWTLSGLVGKKQLRQDQLWAFEDRRIAALEAKSRVIRWCGPLVDELRRGPWNRLPGIRSVERWLSQSYTTTPWSVDEFMAASLIEASFLSITGICLLQVIGFSGLVCFVVGFTLVVVYCGFVIFRLRCAAIRRMNQLKMRFPFAIDAVAMIMGAGASFHEALQTVAKQCGGHPVGEELTQLLHSLEHGFTFRQAIEKLRQRLHDADIRELMAAAVTSHELGTPLVSTLLELGQRMRISQSQLLETRAAQANVAIQGPAFLVLVSCVVIIMVPFLLPAIALWPEFMR